MKEAEISINKMVDARVKMNHNKTLIEEKTENLKQRSVSYIVFKG